MSNETMTLKVIAHIHTAFPTTFGIPRQRGLVAGLRGAIIFTPEYRNADALRGLADFSHIWLCLLYTSTPLKNLNIGTNKFAAHPHRIGELPMGRFLLCLLYTSLRQLPHGEARFTHDCFSASPIRRGGIGKQ